MNFIFAEDMSERLESHYEDPSISIPSSVNSWEKEKEQTSFSRPPKTEISSSDWKTEKPFDAVQTTETSQIAQAENKVSKTEIESDTLKNILKEEKKPLDLLLERNPELKEYQNQIAMLEQKYPNYLSLFLQDITNQDELGKQRFWGKKWNAFQQRAKALLTDQTTDLVHKEQEFAKLFDAWIPLQIEQWRGEVDRDRVAQKKQKLFAFYQQYGGENQNPDLRNQQYEQLAQAGTLTMEIFLDDVLARLTPQLTKFPLVNLYQYWESQKIQQISKKNQTFEAFYQTLKLSSTNNEDFKKIAQKQKAELFTKKLTPEAFKKEAYAIDQQWHRIARESYGMLNREEVIRSAFVNIKESDYKGYGVLLKKIQAIGKIYYGDQKVAVDGFWGPDTQAVVLSLRQKEELQSIRPALDRILAANEDFGLKAQERSKKLTENQVPGIFDKAQQAFSSSSSAQEITSEKGKEEKTDHKPQKTHLNTALEEMSSEEVENCIPRADYLQALETFLKAQQLPMSLKSDPLLADNILKGTGSGEEYEAVVQLWNQSQTKAQLLIAWKANLQAKITQEAQQSVQKAVNTTLKSFGIELGPQELHAIAQGKVSEFTDPLHSELRYRFDPATGELSLKNGVLLEEKAKKLSLHTDRFNPLFKIPTLKEFTDKAADLQSYLPHQRPQDKESFEKDLQQSLQERIRYQMGTVEKQTLSEHLQNEQMKSSCIQELKQLLDLPAEGEISLERNPAYYEMLFPILLTLEKRTENAELHQLLDILKTIRSFVRSDQQSFANEESRQQYDRNNPILGVLSDFDVKNDLKIHGNQKRKADFALGVFFWALEKPLPWRTGNLENRVLDLEKIKFLNTTKEREKLDLDPRYGKWYQKLVRDIKTSERLVKESVQREHDKVRIQEIEEEIAWLSNAN